MATFFKRRLNGYFAVFHIDIVIIFFKKLAGCKLEFL